METNKIYLGDCVELLEEVESGSVDLVVTDPQRHLTNFQQQEPGQEFLKDERRAELRHIKKLVKMDLVQESMLG